MATLLARNVEIKASLGDMNDVREVVLVLDIVENLGHFLELEVVLGDHESVEDGSLEANRIMKMLDIHEAQLLAGAYVDLMARSAPS